MHTLRLRIFWTILCSVLCFSTQWPVAASTTQPTASCGTCPSAARVIENVGQFDARARFLIEGDGLTLWVTDDGLWVTVPEGNLQPARPTLPDPTQADTVSPTGRGPVLGTSFHLTFPGSTPTLEPFARQETVVSYFTPAGQFPNVPVWGGVRMGLFPGLSLEISSQNGQPLLLFNTDGRDLPLLVEGAEALRLENAQLVLSTARGEITLPLQTTAPLTVHASAKASSTTLILSPAASAPDGGFPAPTGLVYSSYLGGLADDSPNTVALTAAGERIVAGDTYSAVFPSGPGLDVPTHYIAAFISKFDSLGANLLYNITMVSAGLTENVVKDIVVDGDGNAYVGGFTDSADFPTTPGAYDTVPPSETNLYKAFAMKIDPDGDVIFSTLLGTNTNSEVANGIAIDGSGNVYLTGNTKSPAFPTTAGAYDRILGGERDAFITKFNATGSALIYSTFIGGSSPDYGERIALDGSNNVVMSGYSEDGATYPQTGLAIGPAGVWDIVVSKLNASGTGLIYSTVVGGTSYDFYAEGLALDAAGNAYVSGETYGTDFPTTAGAYDTDLTGLVDPVLFKLNSAGTALTFSTYLGGSSAGVYEFIYDLALDSANAPYVIGYSDSADFPTTPLGYRHTLSGPVDMIVVKVNPSGAGLEYSTYLGGTLEDYGTGIVVKAPNEFMVVGYSYSSDYPVTPSAYALTSNGGSDGVITAFAPLPYHVFLPIALK
ncbi:MAG TPA: SBBP repeat-containing protein [Anaerolineales bacterium]|nr:SBBP repeat-containing protein [Anaerolineales bacterium]